MNRQVSASTKSNEVQRHLKTNIQLSPTFAFLQHYVTMRFILFILCAICIN
jgi:hypothetical protein